MTRAAGRTSASRRVASMPSTRGMRRSMRTTSAARATASRTASSPSAAVPTTSMPGSSPRSISSPSRTTRWSSASSTRIGSPSIAAPLRDEQFDAEARVGRRGGETSPQQLRALAHAGQPVAEAGLALALDGARVPVGADVLHDEARAVGLVAQTQVDVGGARVAAHVRQRLLGGAVDGEARLGAELARPAVEREVAVDVRPLTEGPAELVQALRPRHVLAPQSLDRAPRLLQARAGEAVAALDRVRHVGVRAARACEQPGALQLDGERRERMGQDVVHLPG